MNTVAFVSPHDTKPEKGRTKAGCGQKLGVVSSDVLKVPATMDDWPWDRAVFASLWPSQQIEPTTRWQFGPPFEEGFQTQPRCAVGSFSCNTRAESQWIDQPQSTASRATREERNSMLQQVLEEKTGDW